MSINKKTDRYDRQTRLPEIGQAGQDKLREAAILCVGAGGLGAPALLYLAAAGVGRIGIIDFDRVEESNLQRQVIFSGNDTGKPKARVAAEKLKALNPDIRVDCYEAELNAESAARLFPSYDIILDGTDNFETKFLINDAAIKFGKPWIYGAIQGFDGQASVFNEKGGPCYRCLQPEKPKGPIQNCAENGVIGAAVGIIGVTQALQAIQMFVGHDDFSPLIGKIWLLDTRTMQTKTLALQKNPHCPVCARKPEEIILRHAAPACDFIPEISAAQLKEQGPFTLIDVREMHEWDKGHIGGAVLWPLSRLVKGDFPALGNDERMILYCQKGGRSLQAARLMKGRGFKDVTNLNGGYASWQENTQAFRKGAVCP